ncbi:hypothetical protein [Erwinia amylovora]|uniref:Uncharacterized protein n=4 Tax=Erwinia amylovora TaxID=552 RepID=A0A831ERR8_ERWAM|nr:hypothetical protein [Erwinia amylovora]CBX79947.1 hypothetical protein predicted by Glimmer/Critica [Erwinia amylovora ATCC BAA-2158]CCP02493.1 hypothetical protein BN439_1416 [Erwinia amylovora Ea644]CCP06502.1 hypothetical protein BN440_1460 [Erwinia amylovora MR1]CDK14646.1 hypothetical protein LA635_1022 [Erwinia amylovora LA635]CDK18014.1 hypothetical protein LA636_1022 [Erwinia amylovora LA636]CDK21383.1 hypothetical protein LA637_1023 [Erwinia amylovora LA637]
MSTINTSMGRYCIKADNAGDHIQGSIAINDEGGTQLTRQEFSEHYLDDVINNVVFPVTGGNRVIANAIREQMINAGFAQSHR